jgi:sulfite reductase (NADPH) hemoprotein beta-component
LPSKFDISFSACESDCAMGSIQDLSVIAVKKNEKVGFKISLGRNDKINHNESITIEEFVEEDRVVMIIESLITLHERYSNRDDTENSRVISYLNSLGEDQFRKQYQKILEEIELRLENEDVDQHLNPMRWCNIDFKARMEYLTEPKSTHRYSLESGKMSIRLIKKICHCMSEFGIKQLRTTQGQDLLFVDVKDKYLDMLIEQIGSIERLNVDEITPSTFF